ncbi:vWA domain-containing protein [Holophaga foetida]|uniref:vWA domain-containing protein n=1 Tax=Holophaga foetida TaxID=35839 RepID=UPI000247467E|nr:VWA domain-containing protein [Holophaga foetida]
MNTATAIVEFCQVLRGLGVRVSTTEALDAAKALAHIDWHQADEFKTCLQATLIKRMEDRPLFQQAFATYFQPTRKPCGCGGHRTEAQEEAETEFLFQGKPLDIPEDLKEVHKQLSPEDQRRITDFLERTSTGHNVTEKFQSIAERMVTGSLEYWRRQLAEQAIQSLQVDYTGNPRIDAALEASTEALQSSLPALMQRDLAKIAESELPQVLQLMKRMAKALATQLSRRRRKSRAAQQVDLRRTIRVNLRYGGTLLKVCYRQRSRTKPKILLLCDVSGSMARYVAFVLQFLGSVANLAYNIESFIFAEELERLTPSFRAHPSMKELSEAITSRSAQWGKGTHLQQSLVSLRTRHRRVIQPGTVVIILSDTKTLQADAAAEELGLLRRSVKRIIWLNTLPREEWPRHRTTGLFQRHARMLPCNTLADLAKIVGSEIFHLGA